MVSGEWLVVNGELGGGKLYKDYRKLIGQMDKEWGYSGSTVALQWLYSGSTVALQWLYSGSTVALQ